MFIIVNVRYGTVIRGSDSKIIEFNTVNDAITYVEHHQELMENWNQETPGYIIAKIVEEL